MGGEGTGGALLAGRVAVAAHVADALRAAGFRTYALVCLGSAIVMVASTQPAQWIYDTASKRTDLDVELVDLRLQAIEVTGQDILTRVQNSFYSYVNLETLLLPLATTLQQRLETGGPIRPIHSEAYTGHQEDAEGRNRSGNSRRYIVRAVEDSLRRLNTDWIDLYQVHRPDYTTDIEETLSVLTDLVRDGKIAAVGRDRTAQRVRLMLACALGQ